MTRLAVMDRCAELAISGAKAVNTAQRGPRVHSLHLIQMQGDTDERGGQDVFDCLLFMLIRMRTTCCLVTTETQTSIVVWCGSVLTCIGFYGQTFHPLSHH